MRQDEIPDIKNKYPEYRWVYSKILDSLEFRDEYNPVINMWLKENKKDICGRLGINFVYNNVI